MPKPRVYIETTIPSAYHTDRTDPEMVARCFATRRWWKIAAAECELVTSRAVLQELSRGRSEQVVRRLALMDDLRLMLAVQEVSLVADMYIRHKLMPADPSGDALHLALASYHQCDVLVTWNYRHLANPTKFERIRLLNRELGLAVPRIATPLDLLEGGTWTRET